MALISCPECGKQISDQAPACIHCGYPLPKQPTAPAAPPSPDRFSVVLTACPDGPETQSLSLIHILSDRLSRISFTNDIDSDLVKNADLVIEAVFEDREVKRVVTEKAEAAMKDVYKRQMQDILGHETSSPQRRALLWRGCPGHGAQGYGVSKA